MSIPFIKSRLLHYDEYLSDLQSQEVTDLTPESSLVYLDERYSQAILLANLLMWNEVEHPNILKPFVEYVRLIGIDSFRLKIRTDKSIRVRYTDSQEMLTPIDLLTNLNPQETQGSVFVRSQLEKLKRCSTAWYTINESDLISSANDDSNISTNQYLILDYKVNDSTKQAFQFHFENPLKLFELFQLLFALDQCELSTDEKRQIYNTDNVFIGDDSNRLQEDKRILRFKDFKIHKEKLTKSIFTKTLSDGEHQFLHSLGLCLLFKNTNSLFLFDEPETHFNPDWKAKFISSIRDCFKNEREEKQESILREMLITTHSPYLISDNRAEYVLIFRKDIKTNKIHSVLRPQFQTFGCSVNKIAIRIYEMPNTIGEYAASILDEFKSQFEKMDNKEQIENLLDKLENTLGESVEKTLFINKIFNKLDNL